MNIKCIILTYMFNRHRKCKNGGWELLNTQFLVFNIVFFKGIYSHLKMKVSYSNFFYLSPGTA